MRAALHGSYVEYVIFTGIAEMYPMWFEEQLYECTYTDESRFTFWVNREERRPDYHEKQLIEEYSVILRKSNGEVHVTDQDVFSTLYTTFVYDGFTNSGIAAFSNDCIEYVDCKPGMLLGKYPHWFYEYFTEAIVLPNEFEGYMLLADHDEVEVIEHCVVLRNRFNEIRTTTYESFIKHYDPNPLQYHIGRI